MKNTAKSHAGIDNARFARNTNLPLLWQCRSDSMDNMDALIDTIITGDNCDVLKRFPDDCIDLVVTSPPYDNLRVYGGHTWNFEGVARELTRVLKPGGVIVWVVADATINGSETLTSMRQAIFLHDQCGMNVHDTMIWEKSSFSAVGSLAVRYAPSWEYMFIISKGNPKTFNPIKDKPNINAGVPLAGTKRQADGSMMPISASGKGKIISDLGQRKNIWKINEEKTQNSLHPAVFPEQIAADHILSWSNPGDIVLDPFSGSGTTCVAAKALSRHWIGIEINEEYNQMARRRIESTEMPLL
jgi:DNA modification methylase